MMKWYFVFLASVVVILVALVVQFGLNPRPKPIIKPSHFSDFGVIGQTIFQQLHKDIKLVPIVALGVHHTSDLDVIEGLVSESQKYAHPFHSVLILNHLKDSLAEKLKTSHLKVKVFDVGRYSSILTFLGEGQRKSEKTLIVANPEDVSHLQGHSLIQLLEDDLGLSILSFLRLDCLLEPEKLRDLQRSCRLESKETTSFSHLSCLAYHKSVWLKKLRSRRLDKTKNIVFLQQYGLLDYIYFIKVAS